MEKNMSDTIENEPSFERFPEDRGNPYVMINKNMLKSEILTMEDIGYYTCFEAEIIPIAEIPRENQERIAKAYFTIWGGVKCAQSEA